MIRLFYLALFFHRYMLRKSGLWAKSSTKTLTDLNARMNDAAVIPVEDQNIDPQKVIPTEVRCILSL